MDGINLSTMFRPVLMLDLLVERKKIPLKRGGAGRIKSYRRIMKKSSI